jgi:hypothetical protein
MPPPGASTIHLTSDAKAATSNWTWRLLELAGSHRTPLRGVVPGLCFAARRVGALLVLSSRSCSSTSGAARRTLGLTLLVPDAAGRGIRDPPVTAAANCP